MARVTNEPLNRHFVALTGIDFETSKRKRRIEAGDELPADIEREDIEDLLEIRAIRVKEEGGEA